MTANLNGGVASAVTQLVGLGNQGESIPFFIRGTTSNPSFVPDVKGMLTGQIGSQIGNLLKSKLQGKSGQNSFAGPKSLAGQKSSQSAPSQKTSVLKKFTGWFHKNKQDQNTKK